MNERITAAMKTMRSCLIHGLVLSHERLNIMESKLEIALIKQKERMRN